MKIPIALAVAALTLGACTGDGSSDDRGAASTVAATTQGQPTTVATTPAAHDIDRDPATSTSSTAPTSTASPTSTTGTPAPPTESDPPPDPRTETRAIEVAGETRHYVLHIPEGLPTGPVPLVLDMHGLTATADRQDKVSGMRAKAADAGFVVAQPESVLPANAWDTLRDSRDVAFIRAVVSDVGSLVEIDPHRVYASGFSAGGGLANRLACDAGDLVAAIASVGGAHLGWANCDPARPIPVIAFHGDRDLVIPYDGLAFLPDIEEWAAAWGQADECNPRVDITRPARDVETLAWTGCSQGAEVVLYHIEGGGHGWPGTDDPSREGDTTNSVDATDLIWDFFSAHPMPPV